VEYPDAAKGKCETCGFLSKHPIAGSHSLPAPRFYEIERHERCPIGNPEETYRRLFVYHPDLAAYKSCKTDLFCFVGEADLMEDIQKIPDYDNPKSWAELSSVAVRVIAFDRHCHAWYPYTPGFSPREHYEELRMQQLEIDRRAFDLRLSEMNRKAQEDSLQVAEASKAIVGDLKDIALANDEFTRRVTALVILLAVLQTIFTVLALPNIPAARRGLRRFCCVPSIFDSLEVKVLYPT
jgi:hypothetical protein